MSAIPPERPVPEKGDVYSAGERAWMLRTQELRGRLLEPVLRLLIRARITPDNITFAATIAGLAFCPLYLWSPALAFAALALHVALDGLDGPLARKLATASHKGSFTDTMSDQIVVTATTLTLVYAGVVGAIPGAVYVVSYMAVVMFSIARNYLARPYSWLLRPRFFVYGWMIVETWVWPGTIDIVVCACSVPLIWKTFTGFFGIRREL